MKALLTTLLLLISLTGCESETSSENLTVDDEIKLSVKMYVDFNDSDFYSQSTNVQFFIKLRTDNDSKSIKVSEHDLFIMEIDGKDYDLSNQFHDSSSLTSGGEYRVTFNDFDLTSKEIYFIFHYKVHSLRASYSLPRLESVTNHTMLTGAFNPLYDDIYLSWSEITSANNIEVEQTVYYIDNSSCEKPLFSMDTNSNASDVIVKPSHISSNCNLNEEHIKNINTFVTLEKSKIKLASDYASFDSTVFSIFTDYKWQVQWDND